MDTGLAGKTVLVTAGTEGLGYACAARFVDAGCAVAVCGRRPDKLDAAREALLDRKPSGQVAAIPANLTRIEDLERLVKTISTTFGGPDILIVNSGHARPGGPEDLDDAAWQHAFDLFLMSAVRLTRLVLPLMRARGSGDIVFVGSRAMREPSPHLLLSSVMRLGLAGLSKAVATYGAVDNIRANLVCPGYFDTGDVRGRIDAAAERDNVPRSVAMSGFAAGVPLGRLGDAAEFGELVAFVASRRASFLTGAAITIDGGTARSIG